MTFTATFDRPVPATLHVHLANGEQFEASAEDLARFGLVPRREIYRRFQDHLLGVLQAADAQLDGLTATALNPLRYLVELAVSAPDLLTHPETAATDADVVVIERALQLLACGHDQAAGELYRAHAQHD